MQVVVSTPRHRHFVFTLNNWTAADIDYLDSLPVRYLVYGKETAPSTGTPHLQGYIVFANGKTVTAARTVLRRCRIAVAAGTPSQASVYCKKDGDFVERGDLPADPAQRGSDEADRWITAWDSAKRGDFEAIPADIRIRSYSTLKRIFQDYMPAVLPLPDVCGIWIFGLSGSGKTRSVLQSFPDAFIKPRNQWWDGYQDEPTVLLDDVDKFDVKLGGALKHWADFAPFIAEIKGGSKKIRPRQLIITSQYCIGDIWQDAETRTALTRRFRFIEKIGGVDIII